MKSESIAVKRPVQLDLISERSKANWREYVAISKTGIVISNLMTTFAGLVLAAYYTNTTIFQNSPVMILTLLGSAMIIAGGCALNNYIDRDIDHLMERTKERPSVTGILSGQQVLTYGLVMSIAGIGLLAFTTWTAVLFGIIGIVVYVILYSLWTKRTTTLNTIVGSFSGAVPPLIGWAAIDPTLHSHAWLLFLIMFIWQPPHFLALAMRRVEEYRAAGIPMLPVVAGFKMTKRQIMWYVAILIPITLAAYPFGTIYLISAFLLSVGWLVYGFIGFNKKDDVKWATGMFVYSLNHLTILFAVIILVHLF